MENTPISSGGSPVSAMASRRESTAASSMGVMVGSMWSMSRGKRMRMSRSTVGQLEEIWGMTRFWPEAMACRE